MKINKKLTEDVEVKKLTEDEETLETELETEVTPEATEDIPEDGEGETTVENPADASVEEIADAITAGVEVATDGEQTVTPEEAEKLAQEVKNTASEIDTAALGSLWVENDLTEVLDDALKTARKLQRQGRRGNANVLVTGLPGSSKTAVVYEWASRNGLNIHYIDAKNNDLEADMNGYTMRDTKDLENNSVAKAYSKVLDPLDRPNSVLFLDELNRQINPGIRASLLTLVNEKCVSGNDDSGRRYFKNLLFTIACINPAVPTDRGAAALNDAEKSRYVYSVEFDSTPSTALDYFKRHYTVQIAKLDPNDDYFMEDLGDYLKCLGIALHILTHASFSFNTRDDLENLADLQKNMLNQRSLTDAIVASGGDRDKLLRWVDLRSDFLEETKEMLKAILESYNEEDGLEKAKRVVLSTIKALADNGKASDQIVNHVTAAIEGKPEAEVTASSETDGNEATAETDTGVEAGEAESEEEFEDDADLFQGNAASGRASASAATRRQRISTITW